MIRSSAIIWRNLYYTIYNFLITDFNVNSLNITWTSLHKSFVKKQNIFIYLKKMLSRLFAALQYTKREDDDASTV